LEANARLLVIEPQLPLVDDPPLVRWYANTLEEGQNLRSMTSLQRIVNSVHDLTIQSTHLVPICATPFSWPLCANFIVIETRRVE
jgi:hypothetical protein